MVLRKRPDSAKETSDDKKEAKVKISKKKTADADNTTSSWSLRWFVTTACKVFLIVIVLPAFLNFSALIHEEKQLVPPGGVLIDIKYGQKLFRSCAGTGSPTVILDAPCGETSDVWTLIYPAIAKFTRVCVYDRAGLGFSERVRRGVNETKKSGKAHTVERMVEDVHKLFENEARPFTLVGADLGATVVKFYAQLYQDDVASVVFINPIFEGIFLGGSGNPWSKYWYTSFMPALQLKHILAAMGMTRIGLQLGFTKSPFAYPEVPDLVKQRQKFLNCKPGHVSSIVEESHFLNETLSQLRTLQQLRPYSKDLPTSVVWTNKYSEKLSADRNQVWLRSQEMFTKATFVEKKHKTVKIDGFLPKALFTQDKSIVKVIRASVTDWRKKSKVESKY